jgi:hypothetical protein
MIDQEIRDALRVDPSPEFLARVRTRIASEPAPPAWRWPWLLAAAGAVAAAALIALVVPRPTDVKPAVPLTRIVQGPVVSERATTPATTTASVAQAPARRVDPARPGGPASARAAGLAEARGLSVRGEAQGPARQADQVLLDPAETRALRGLIAGVREGHVDLTAILKSETPAPMALEPVTDLVIAPIIIEPIAPVSGAEGVRP